MTKKLIVLIMTILISVSLSAESMYKVYENDVMIYTDVADNFDSESATLMITKTNDINVIIIRDVPKEIMLAYVRITYKSEDAISGFIDIVKMFNDNPVMCNGKFVYQVDIETVYSILMIESENK